MADRPLISSSDIVVSFPLHGSLTDVRQYCNGHINDTFSVGFDQAGGLRRCCKAAETDPVGRRKEVLAELDFAFQLEQEVDRLLTLVRTGDISESVTHNDTKLNNVLLDDSTGEVSASAISTR